VDRNVHVAARIGNVGPVVLRRIRDLLAIIAHA
jgi:hypothetical protein